MRSVYKTAAWLLLLSMLSTALPANDRQEFTKAIKREFDISATGTTSLSNKYGSVEVKTWNRNRVKIDVTIIVVASGESEAQSVFDRIDIAFSNSATSVRAVTTIEPRKKGFFSGWSDDKNDYSINFEVFLPATNNLELDHKYGDVFVAALQGKVELDLKYANMKLEGVSDDSSIRFAYGNGSIARAEDLTADLRYAKLRIDEAEDLELTSKYSQLSVERAADVRSDTKYDDYNLGAVQEFKNSGKYDNIDIERAEQVEVDARYTQVNVGAVSNWLDLDLEYGGANIGLAPSFQEVQLAGNYTDFKLAIDRNADFRIDAAATYAGIVYPREMTVTYELEKGSSHELRAHRGAQDAGALIKARLSYGGLKVRTD